MSRPYILFCPYLPIMEAVTFAGWELAPLDFFQDRWADPRFKDTAIAFMDRFLDLDHKPIQSPTLLCREGRQLDGEKPPLEVVRALQLALVFAFVDGNPRCQPGNKDRGSAMMTAENADLHVWPINLENKSVVKRTGYLVETHTAQYGAGGGRLTLSPPLDLHLPSMAQGPDPLVLVGLYETILRSLQFPGANRDGEAIRVAVDWFARAWQNTALVGYPERLVYLKIAFEALTGTSNSWKSGRRLREMFEAVPDTRREDSERLVWSPEEKPVHERCWKNRRGHARSTRMTDLEHWFMEFSDARNRIVHEGATPELTYTGPSPSYAGPFFWTAEFLLRSAIKVKLSEIGYDNVWRGQLWRLIREIVEEPTVETVEPQPRSEDDAS